MLNKQKLSLSSMGIIRFRSVFFSYISENALLSMFLDCQVGINGKQIKKFFKAIKKSELHKLEISNSRFG